MSFEDCVASRAKGRNGQNTSEIDARLSDCESRLGYRFRDRGLLRAALTHSSSAATRKDSNERLEFLGDAVLGLVICHTLFERLPDAQEGELTKIKSAVVSRRVCAKISLELRLTDVMELGQGMEPGAHLPRSLAAAVLESVVAAVFLDGGLEPAREFILREFGEEISRTTDSEHQYNYKAQLQQYAQRHMNATPHYELLDEKGPDHAKCFEVAVSIGHRNFSGAWGPNKKEAEQKAALIALRSLGALPDDDGDGEDAVA